MEDVTGGLPARRSIWPDRDLLTSPNQGGRYEAIMAGEKALIPMIAFVFCCAALSAGADRRLLQIGQLAAI
jgi:hypothetical protein